MTITAHMKNNCFDNIIGLAIRKRLPDGSVEYFTATTVKHEKGNLAAPFMEGEAEDPENQVVEFIQAICNMAYENSIYPEQLRDRNSEIEAVQRHLEDMRTLVFK